MNKDLTVGKPSSVLWRFCLPLFASVIFQQLYNITDSFVAGKFIGNNALAAVGNSYEITLIFIAFSFGCNVGCSVIVSQLFGGKHFNSVKTAVYTTFIAGGILCLILMVGGFIFVEPLLDIIHTPEVIFRDSRLYLEIYMLGLPFVFYYNIATGIFSALGDSKTPFIFLACSSLANIAMDILFVAVWHWGIAGVAWATFICQGISCLIAIFVVLRRIKGIPSQGRVKIFSFRLLKRITGIAVPCILQQSFISVGNIIIQGVINSFGPAAIAGYAAAIKLNNLVITSMTTLGSGISNFTGQNLGAGKRERIREGFRSGIALVWLIVIPIAILYLVAGRELLYIFMESSTGEAMEIGLTFLRIVAPFYMLIAFKIVADGVLRGAGMMNQFMVGTFADLIIRVVLAEILAATALGTTGIWIAWPVGWVISTVIAMVFYIRAFERPRNGTTVVSDE